MPIFYALKSICIKFRQKTSIAVDIDIFYKICYTLSCSYEIKRKKNIMLSSLLNSIFNFNALKRPSPEELIDAADRGDMYTAKKLHGLSINEYYITGVDLNGTNKDGETALMRAAARGHAKFVDWLIENLADVSATDKYGRTAEDRAENTLHKDIAKNLRTAKEHQHQLMFKQAMDWNIKPPMPNL